MATTYIDQINPQLALEAWNYTAPVVAAPTNLRTTGTTSSTISLAWDAVAGTYTLQRAPVDNQGNVGAFATVYTGTTASRQDAGLTFNTTYAYRVLVAVNGVASGYSLAVQAATASGAGDNYITTDYITSDYIN